MTSQPSPTFPPETASQPTPSDEIRRLEERYAELARLVGALAHEVKNPLSTIRLNMELLEEDVEELEDAPQRRRALKRLDTVKRESARLEDLLNEFLTFARAGNLDPVPANVNRELQNVVDFFRPQASGSKIEILEFYSADLPEIQLDKRSFGRAILNLLLNAEQAILARRRTETENVENSDLSDKNENAENSASTDQIVLRTRRVDGTVAVDLIDSGCGMDAETSSRLFEPFYSTKRGGAGLGLPTVRKIVEGVGGRVEAQSEPNRGTQFTLTFPIIPVEPLAETAPPSPVN